MARWGIRLVLFVFAVGVITPIARADPPPVPEPNFATTILPRPCAWDGQDPYERELYEREGWEGPAYERYPGAYQRLKFSYGPILVKPGQNDQLITPVTIEKPVQDGYITRFKPDLVHADDSVPPIEDVHLHHGTWLSVPSYGEGPFFAAGEEKTIAPFPTGYGLPIKATDQWLLLYMVHSAVPQPTEVYITYEIDFIPQAAARDLGLKPAYPIWLDVRPSTYPVFNVQRGYGGSNGLCTWPKEECAAHDPYGKTIVGQGQPGNGVGKDWALPGQGQTLGAAGAFEGGTLIGIGGHVHPGGIRNEIDLVRDGEARRIYTGEAVYWSRDESSQPGGPPTSWDFSMTVTGAPYWGVRVEPGDILRSNATYDTTHQSTYENMGIAVALVAPDDESGPTARGVDPFDPAVAADTSAGCQSTGLLANPPMLCDKGIVTHGHLSENDNFGGPQGTWTAESGPSTENVAIGSFLFAPGDISTISSTGVPTVNLGSTLRFTNLDGASIYHTVTTCKFPCLGPTGTSFPISNGATSTGRQLDFDSSELGIGPAPLTAAKNELTWDLAVTEDEGFEAGETVTYYCRIHPFMRGAFEVTE